MLYIPIMTKDQKEQYLELSKDFLEKQKNLFFRMSLSDDPEAKSVCEQIMGNAKMFGIVVETNPNELFTYLENIIDKLEESINS